MLKTQAKQAIIKKFKAHDTDTGSTGVQVALLSAQIDELADHLKKNKKDFHSRRGLLKIVANRRTLMRYMEKHEKKSYDSVVRKLGLKK
jgi:small subunit ribosomal protein S15